MAGNGTRRGKRRDWTPEEDRILLARRKARVHLDEIAAELDRSIPSCGGRYHRLLEMAGHEPKRRPGSAPRESAYHQFRELPPAINPNTPDSSTPKYAEDERHLALIAQANGGKGFPYLNIPPAYRVAA